MGLKLPDVGVAFVARAEGEQKIAGEEAVLALSTAIVAVAESLVFFDLLR